MPAAVLTYDTLVQDIIRYSERDDQSFVEQIPRMIMLAEQEIAAQVKTLWELVVVETTILSGSQGATLEKPARWRKTVSMKINGQPVLLRGQDYVAQAQNELPSGQPKLAIGLRQRLRELEDHDRVRDTGELDRSVAHDCVLGRKQS